MSHFLYSNQSIVSILLSSLYLFVIAIFLNGWKKFNLFPKIVFVVLFFISLYLLISTNGRAGWIGFIIGMFFLVKHIFPFPKAANKGGLFALLFILLLLALLVFLKKDSSLGRLLIYKVSANIFQENWLWGIGLGNFKVNYNLYQATYFSTHNINSKEALLADNTFYAFNDLWQLLIEIGAVGFTSLVILLALLLNHFRKYKINPGKAYLFYGAFSALLCIMVASLFSYPFQVFSLQLLALIYLALVFFSLQTPKESYRKSNWTLLGMKVLCCASILILCCYGYIKIMLLKKSNEAFDLSRAGYKREALNTYASFQQSFIKNGPAMFSYVKQLYSSNKLVEATTSLNEAKKYYVDNEVYKLSASMAYELGNMQQAEEDYKTALYMVPNRMRSRYELFNFYLNTKDTANALFWGQSILNMPIKVPSSITQNLQKQTGNILQELVK